MAKNTSKPKAIKINLPPPPEVQSTKILPIEDVISQMGTLCISFKLFDRTHKFFNLGGNEKDGTVGGKWFVHLLDCLKEIGSKTVQDLKKRPYLLHPVNWDNANAKCPFYPQANWFQFRVNKSRGRVIGILIDEIFYVVWLDPYHNLTDSEGYGGVKTFSAPKIT